MIRNVLFAQNVQGLKVCVHAFTQILELPKRFSVGEACEDVRRVRASRLVHNHIQIYKNVISPFKKE